MSLETHPPAGTVVAVVNVLPATPYDGQECYYLASDTQGVVWRLRYRAASASAYKWEVVGGAPLRGVDLAQLADPTTGETTSSTTGADLATLGPDVTLPLAGDYLAAFGATVTVNTGPSNAQMTIQVAAAAIAPADGWLTYIPAANQYFTGMRDRQLLGVAAGSLVRCKYMVFSAAHVATWTRRWLNVLPLRVG